MQSGSAASSSRSRRSWKPCGHVVVARVLLAAGQRRAVGRDRRGDQHAGAARHAHALREQLVRRLVARADHDLRARGDERAVRGEHQLRRVAQDPRGPERVGRGRRRAPRAPSTRPPSSRTRRPSASSSRRLTSSHRHGQHAHEDERHAAQLQHRRRPGRAGSRRAPPSRSAGSSGSPRSSPRAGAAATRVISSQPSTCEVSASVISQPALGQVGREVVDADRPARRRATTTAATSDMSNSAPAGRRRSMLPWRCTSRNAA